MLLLYKNLRVCTVDQERACVAAYFPHTLCSSWVETIQNCQYLTILDYINSVFRPKCMLVEMLRHSVAGGSSFAPRVGGGCCGALELPWAPWGGAWCPPPSLLPAQGRAAGPEAGRRSGLQWAFLVGAGPQPWLQVAFPADRLRDHTLQPRPSPELAGA